MAKVKSISELREALKERCEKATKETFDFVYDRFHIDMSDYYSEFEPKVYGRTEQLKRSLKEVKPSILNLGYGIIIRGKIYFDTDSLDYSYATFKNGYKYKKKGWTHENDLWVFRTSALGNGIEDSNINLSHGNYIAGTRVWKDPMNILKSEDYYWKDEFKDSLRRNSININ